VKKELDEALCAKYPKIFVNRHGDMKETLMCWGFECGDGWYQILDSLCGQIQHYSDWNNDNRAKGYQQYKEVPQVVAVQVKEKFGGLRFYYNGGDDTIHGMVRMAESWAAHTCEECGNLGKMRHGGWIRTLCDKHEAERTERYAKDNGFEL
jgi:hypothetical protein